MAYFVTADTHFNHANIIRYCGRPFSSAEEMNETLLANWNATVGPDDVVLHLGDTAFGPVGLDYMRRCQGRKILIRGNHDKGFSNGALFRAGFEAVYKSYANPFIYYPEGMTAEKISVIINHFPDVCMSDFWTPCLCGHVHDKWEYKCGWLNVGVDVWGFKPVRLDKAVFIWHEVRKFGVNFNI